MSSTAPGPSEQDAPRPPEQDAPRPPEQDTPRPPEPQDSTPLSEAKSGDQNRVTPMPSAIPSYKMGIRQLWPILLAVVSLFSIVIFMPQGDSKNNDGVLSELGVAAEANTENGDKVLTEVSAGNIVLALLGWFILLAPFLLLNPRIKSWLLPRLQFDMPEWTLEQTFYALILIVLLPSAIALPLAKIFNASSAQILPHLVMLVTIYALLITRPEPMTLKLSRTAPSRPSIPKSFAIKQNDFARGILGGFVLLLPANLAAHAVSYLLDVLYGMPIENHPAIDMFALGDTPSRITIGIQVLLFAPILEELLFRGLLFGSLYKIMSPRLATFITAVAFAVVHPTPGNMAATFVLSYGLVALYRHTGRLIVPIMAHATFNTIPLAVMLAS